MIYEEDERVTLGVQAEEKVNLSWSDEPIPTIISENEKVRLDITSNEQLNLKFGEGHSGGGGSSVYWEDILNKPYYYPPSLHTHILADVTDFDTLTNMDIERLLENMA